MTLGGAHNTSYGHRPPRRPKLHLDPNTPRTNFILGIREVQVAAELEATHRRAQGCYAIVVPWSEDLWVDNGHGGRSCSIASPEVLCNQAIADALNKLRDHNLASCPHSLGQAFAKGASDTAHDLMNKEGG